MKTTNEIIKDSAIILKNEIIVINDNDKKWYSEEEIREVINSCKRIISGQNQRCIEHNRFHNQALKILENELFGDEK